MARPGKPKSLSENAHLELLNFLSMSVIEASLMNARALRFKFSQSLANRRQRLSHAMGIGVEVEQPGLLDQAAGLDEVAGVDLAAGVLELGFLFGQPGFLLFVRAQTLSQ
jgi:hypothetical protein